MLKEEHVGGMFKSKSISFICANIWRKICLAPKEDIHLRHFKVGRCGYKSPSFSLTNLSASGFPLRTQLPRHFLDHVAVIEFF